MAESDTNDTRDTSDWTIRNDVQHNARGDALAHRTTRRQLLRRAGMAGASTAAGVALGGWLAACGSSAARRASAPTAQVPTATPEPRPTATSDTRPATIAITGDIMLARSVNTTLLSSHDRFPFNYTADYLRGFDLTEIARRTHRGLSPRCEAGLRLL